MGGSSGTNEGGIPDAPETSRPPEQPKPAKPAILQGILAPPWTAACTVHTECCGLPAGPSVYSTAVEARIEISEAPTLGAAAEEVVRALEAGAAPEARGWDLALVLVTTAHGELEPTVAAEIGARVGARRTAVAQVEGLLGPDAEWVARPGLAVVALRGDLAVHSVDHARGREAEVGEELAACLGPLGRDDLVLAIADAHELDARALAAGLGACFPASVLGVGVEGAAGSSACHALDGERASGGVLGVRLSAASELRCALAPGVRLREIRRADEVRGNWIYRLSGASALEEFRDAAGVLWNDENRARRSVFVALPDGEGKPPHAALVRAVVGTDEESGAIALADSVEAGSQLAFAVRDADAAREALSIAAGALDRVAAQGLGVGFAASCPDRGAQLFGHEGLEAGYLASAFGFAPWVGLIGSFQIAGTPNSSASLLTHSAALVRLV